MKSNLVSKRQFNGAENSSALVSPVTTVSRKDGVSWLRAVTMDWMSREEAIAPVWGAI
jgi:hypothetical protein